MDGAVTACTVITANRAAHARALARSFLEHHPRGRLVALVLDDPGDRLAGEPFAVVRPADLPLAREEFLRMAAIYDGLELSCAMKPWILEHVLASGAPAAVYLDSDVQVFGGLEEVCRLAREHTVVLTPHLTRPPATAADPEELARLAGGVFNNGFLAVGPGGRAFLEWWRGRLARDCLDAIEEGVFVDQRWIDLVPAWFPFAVLRDPGYNLAPWNAFQRTVREEGGRLLVNGLPLRFVHFSGFAPEEPYVLSKWLKPAPRTLLSEHPLLARLCREYADLLFEHGYERCAAEPYGFASLPDGTVLDRPLRRRYRRALVEAEERGGPPPPNPFEEPDAFRSWLARDRGASGNAPRPAGGGGGAAPGVTGDGSVRAVRDVVSALEAAAPALAASSSRGGPAGRLRRAAVFRLLRPYTRRRAELDAAVAAALAGELARLEELEARVEALLGEETTR